MPTRRHRRGSRHHPQARFYAPDEAERGDALAEHWVRIGLMEHASIAAFARFTLHLLALGAPPDLVLLSQQATSDEAEHARLAFSLASAYCDAQVGPDALGLEGSLEGFDVAAILVTLVREGCIGETVAAIEAAEALPEVRDLVVRTVLERIAQDELRHAELAWRTLGWLVASGRVCRSAARAAVVEGGKPLPLHCAHRRTGRVEGPPHG